MGFGTRIGCKGIRALRLHSRGSRGHGESTTALRAGSEQLSMWNWLEGLKGGAPVVIGSLAGSSIGLFALLLGAFFNAHLNRRRDDRLRQIEISGVASALSAELNAIACALELNAKSLEKEPAGFVGPDIFHLVHLYPQMIPKLTLLDAESIRLVVDAYSMIEQHMQNCMLFGVDVTTTIPNRRILGVKPEQNQAVAGISKYTAEEIRKAIKSLERFQIATPAKAD
jgi:hypothetical protein